MKRQKKRFCFSISPEGGWEAVLGQPLDRLVWPKEHMTWFQKTCIQVLLLSPNDPMILGESLNFPEFYFQFYYLKDDGNNSRVLK